MNSKNIGKKIVNIISNILLVVFLVLCVFSVIVTISAKKDTDGAAEIWGYQMRVVTSESMAACDQTDVSEFEIGSIPLRSMIFVERIPQQEQEADQWYRQIKPGDVLTFRYVYTNQVTITHRVTSIQEKPTGGFIIELAGDNVSAGGDQLYQVIDTSIPENTNYVIGKVVGQSRVLGFVISLLKNPLGIILIVILPCFIIILLEVVKIVHVCTADRRKREAEEKQRKDDELEELRRRLAQLEQKDGPPETDPAEENR